MFSQAVVILLVSGLARSISDERERPVCRAATNCHEGYSTPDEFFFRVNGGQVRVEFLDGKHFVMCCDCNEENKPVAIDDPSLPAMPRLVTVDKLIIRNCLPPGHPAGSYASALAALNVTTTQLLHLDRQPTEPSLKRAHLTGLSIASLRITAINPLLPGDGILTELHQLRTLRLDNVVLSPTELETLPSSLETLKLFNARLSSAEPLGRLLSLKTLVVTEQTVGGNLTLPPLAALPNLTEMSLYRINLAKIEGVINGSALKTLWLDSCGLTTLPSNMFERVNLTTLSLAGNQLSDLPNGVFAPLRSLTHLDLSRNVLTASALRRTLPALQNLLVLNAEGNPLGSLCSSATNVGTDTSLLPISLKTLLLSGTNATRVCADWVVAAENLTTIDLSYNNIEVLAYTDLMMKKRDRSEVTLNLRGNRNVEVCMTCADVDQCCGEVLSPGLRAKVLVELNELTRDCRHTWLRAALNHCRPLLSVEVHTKCDTRYPPGVINMPAHGTLLEYEPYEPYCPYGDCVPRCSSWKRNATSTSRR